MKKILTLAAAALLCASMAYAQATPPGINLYGFAGAAGNACDAAGLHSTLTGTCGTVGTAMKLYSTVSIPRPLVALAACGQTIDVKTVAAALPDWWRLDACRGGKTIPTMNGGVAGLCAGGTIWDGNTGSAPLVVEGYTPDGGGTGTMRMQMGAAVGSPYDVPSDFIGYELAVGSLQLNNGPSTCTGCGNASCLVLKEVTLNEDGNAAYPHVTTPIVSNYVTWLGNGPAAPNGYCPAATPATNRTWGSLKSLYR